MEMSRNVDIAIRQVENSAKCPMGPLKGAKLGNCQKIANSKNSSPVWQHLSEK